MLTHLLTLTVDQERFHRRLPAISAERCTLQTQRNTRFSTETLTAASLLVSVQQLASQLE